MKYFITIFLSLIFLSTVLRDTWTIASFHINRAYIASSLCINKDKPAMCCKGKCVLQKRLKENNDQDSENPAKRLADKLEKKYVLEDIVYLNCSLIITTKKTYPRNKQSLTPTGYLSRIFHPPKIFV